MGVHPDSELDYVVSAQMLVDLAANPACIAIGETGLDYYRTPSEEGREIQRARFVST